MSSQTKFDALMTAAGEQDSQNAPEQGNERQ
jgi:hypothetical protein